LVEVSSIQLHTTVANVALLAGSQGSCPGTLLWQGTTASVPYPAWVSVPVSPPIRLTPGQTYFLASQSDSGSLTSVGTDYTECIASTLAGPWSVDGADRWTVKLSGMCE
jgi:hypothetical protein